MRCQPAGDPLAVWTFVQAGEEVASGDPSATDQQRAAAGRETTAKLILELGLRLQTQWEVASSSSQSWTRP